MSVLEESREIPAPSPVVGRRALSAMLREGSILAGLSVFHDALGDVFRFSFGAFRPVFMVGPEASRFVLVSARDNLHWRPERDPVTRLLRQGLLVTDRGSARLAAKPYEPRTASSSPGGLRGGYVTIDRSGGRPLAR